VQRPILELQICEQLSHGQTPRLVEGCALNLPLFACATEHRLLICGTARLLHNGVSSRDRPKPLFQFRPKPKLPRATCTEIENETESEHLISAETVFHDERSCELFRVDGLSPHCFIFTLTASLYLLSTLCPHCGRLPAASCFAIQLSCMRITLSGPS